jgi:hypothetical protein
MSGWRVADGDIGSSLRWGVKRVFSEGVFAHAFSFDWQTVGVVDETIEDGISEHGIADDFVPLLDWNLAGDQNRRALMAVFEDFKEIALLGFCELRKTPVIKDQELDARQGLEKLGMTSIVTGQRQRLEQPWNTLIENAFAIPARLVAKGAAYPTFPDTGRPRD